jgi:hypothetical protein
MLRSILWRSFEHFDEAGSGRAVVALIESVGAKTHACSEQPLLCEIVR